MAGPAMESGMLQPSLHLPFDRLKRDDDEFSEPQAVIDTWAEHEGTEQFHQELRDMRVADVQRLMSVSESAAIEHDRRATRARNVKAQVQKFLLDVADVAPAEAEYLGARENVKAGSVFGG